MYVCTSNARCVVDRHEQKKFTKSGAGREAKLCVHTLRLRKVYGGLGRWVWGGCHYVCIYVFRGETCVHMYVHM
jgi:hypothetical protein